MTGKPGRSDLPEGFLPAEGGPFHGLLVRARLTGAGAGRLRRRILALVALTWLPLPFLAAAQGLLAGGEVTVPFLYDITAHVRFLLVVPLLLAAEVFLQSRLRPLAGAFLDRGMVAEPDQPRLRAALASAARLQGSALAEAVILALVYSVGVLLIYEHYTALAASTWMEHPTPAGPVRSLAACWFGLVSLPLFQFLLLRWYYRLLIWILLVLRLSRLKLRLYPAHPDRVGGLGFMAHSVQAFAPFVLAHGVLFAGMAADHILFLGESLADFRLLLLTLAVLLFLVVQAPLLAFTPQLIAARLRGRAQFGSLGVSYVTAFEAKWFRARGPKQPILGSADLQSLADLGSSSGLVASMRATLLSYDGAAMFVLMLGLPLLPLVFLQVPVAELMEKLVSIVL